MLKRLIEVALPLKEISEQSAREKSIRHGHISTLHIWWARRPLAACRAVVFASLIPDPDDPECPASFRELVNEVLRPIAEKCADGAAGKWNDDHRKEIEAGTARGKERKDFVEQYRGRVLVLEFIKDLVKWENSNKPEIIEPARQLIAAAHKFLHPDSPDAMPKVLDPFAGGGAIPLEALRLSCEAHAIDLNPVAHLIELCTLVYPQKYGQPNSRPTPDYIKALEAAHRGRAAKKQAELGFDRAPADKLPTEIDGIAFSRLPLVTEAEYHKNPLVSDLVFWAHWIFCRARDEIGDLYPKGTDGTERIAYVWAHALPCPNPACRSLVPLVKSRWLRSGKGRPVAFDFTWSHKGGSPNITILEGKAITFDPTEGTISTGAMRCPMCETGQYDKSEIKEVARKLGLTRIAICVVRSTKSESRGYVVPDDRDREGFRRASELYSSLCNERADGITVVPDEDIGRDFEWVLKPPMFGLAKWRDNATHRQTVCLAVFTQALRCASLLHGQRHEAEYTSAVAALLGMCLGRLADKSAIQCLWRSDGEYVEHVFGRQAIPMSWDFAEANPFVQDMGSWVGALEWVRRVALHCSEIRIAGKVSRCSADTVPIADGALDLVMTDPPYYDAVPYADLSDFFYVWHKRALHNRFPDLYRTPLTPKAKELVQQSEKVTSAARRKKDRTFFEEGMTDTFREMRRVVSSSGLVGVMFAHKTTTAWEALIQGLTRAGFSVSSSWPIHTEMKARLRAREAAALASSVLLLCRKRPEDAADGYWDDVRNELRVIARERLDFFWKQGIRGADFFISAIGPALSVFGRYTRVTRLSSEEVTVGQFLDEVRQIVTDYALSQILHGVKTGQIDPETRFHVLWKWSYGDAKVPADEAFKLAQALGIPTEQMWDKTGVLEKAGENVLALPITKRMRIKDLGDPNVDGSPASTIDVLHRCCGYRDRGDTAGLAEFLGRSGHAKSEKLWTVAQAISEVLPDGDKEKQLLQGLLNQRERVEKDMATLFTV